MSGGFRNLREYNSCKTDGRMRYVGWRKIPSQATAAGIWFDLSMMPGNPVPNYYASAPLVAATLNGNEGLFHGGDVEPDYKKRLAKLTVISNSATPLPMPMILCDYLLYYPFVDMGTNDDQIMDNTVTLPRYTDGEGVNVIAVMTNPQSSSGTTFNFTYTNSDGTSGRTSRTVTCGAATIFGSLINTATATAGASQHFIGLQGDDKGVRYIEKFNMISGTDVGLITLVLVRQISSMQIRELTAPVEMDYLEHAPSLPIVEDGAYLNFIVNPRGSLSGVTLLGDATFVWS